ncbi:hypothetical protein M422DRAFT_45528 [Sphaerobolus stellatus SS14]|uniref:Uncharacterized protein n=1 Tax=Sphaerobolus stellatus (strain SS14) TaxID=990650 RepID=A0A0C9VWH9_SPHS4|nr:hypothetical protein M422DRAFT_45528 [Sphaerobolus stellatus SS14]
MSDFRCLEIPLRRHNLSQKYHPPVFPELSDDIGCQVASAVPLSESHRSPSVPVREETAQSSMKEVSRGPRSKASHPRGVQELIQARNSVLVVKQTACAPPSSAKSQVPNPFIHHPTLVESSLDPPSAQEVGKNPFPFTGKSKGQIRKKYALITGLEGSYYVSVSYSWIYLPHNMSIFIVVVEFPQE